MKKKILILAIAAVTVATVFGGCGEKQETMETTDRKWQKSGEDAERKDAQNEKESPDEEEALKQMIEEGKQWQTYVHAVGK